MEAGYPMTQHKKTADYVRATTDHAELINGNVVIENSTSVEHNHVVRTICRMIENYIISNHKTCFVFSENVALHFDNTKDYLLPDVMVVCKQDCIQSNGVHAAPDFIAEVTSESTRVRDFYDKMILYKSIGVKEYWVVDLQKQFINVYLLENGFVPEPHIRPDKMKVHICDLTIDTSTFWNSI